MGRDWRKRWLVDNEWEQVKHCLCCNEPFLMVDHIKSSSGTKYETMRRWYGMMYGNNDPIPDWASKTTLYGKEYCDECIRVNRHNIQHQEERKPFVDMQHIRELLYAVREQLGFSEADTRSTFDGWEVCERACYNVRIAPGSIWAIEVKGAVADLLDYMRSVKRISFKSKRPGFPWKIDTKIIKGKRMINWSFLLRTIHQVWHNEIKDWPVWTLNQRKGVLAQLIRHKVVDENAGDINRGQLFDRMFTHMFDGNVTVEDLKMLGETKFLKTIGEQRAKNASKRLREYRKQYEDMAVKCPWFPIRPKLIREPGSIKNKPSAYGNPLYESSWEFVVAFQKHVFGDKIPYRYEDFVIQTMNRKTSLKAGVHSKDSPITRDIGRYWLFNYLCDEMHIEVDEDKFPHDSSNSVLEQFINLDARTIRSVPFATKIVAGILMLDEDRVITNKDKHRVKGIKKIVEKLWPNYKMDHNLWNNMLKGEKRMNSLLNRVMTYNSLTYEWDDALYIPTRTGKYAFYRHSGFEMKIDGLCRELGFASEGQGDYHYAIVGDGEYWEKKIPACYDGDAENYLEYRQELDAKKRRAMKRHGLSPIYVVLSIYACPVKGVHGHIPLWNGKYINDDNPNKIGLAETFDLQDREDIGDMIRDYYYNVVKMTKEMKRKLEE